MLKLPSGKILELENCYYRPKIIRNIISVLLLLQRGYEINGKSNSCSISFSNEIICHGVINNGLLILSNDNVFHINESKKRKREELNNTLLWHCRLGHISETRINKLYKEEFFDLYDYESLGTCESCLMEKMTKTLFSRYGERTSELLGLVHTDVCSPVTTEARGGYSYIL